MIKFVFSALYNETPEFLDVFVANFLHYTDLDAALIVNLGRDLPIPVDRDFGPRVRLIRGEVQRSGWGETLLAGHMQSFGYAEKVFPDFDWFITIASNSMFFRRFDGALAVADTIIRQRPEEFRATWQSLPDVDHWHWWRLRGFEAAGMRLSGRWGIDGLVRGQIEGCIASRADWAITAEVFYDLSGYWHGLQHALEEILPYTVINSIGSGRMGLICHINWTQNFRNVRIDDIICPQDLPRQVCMIKRFQRHELSLETLIVSTPLGQQLLLAMQQAAPGSKEDLHIEVLLRAFLEQVEARRELIPFEPGSKLREMQAPASLDVIAVRQICGLDGGPFEQGEPFLYLENTGARVELVIHAPGPERLFVDCRARPAQEGGDTPSGIQAYLCLPAPQATRLKLSGHLEGEYVENFVNRIVWGDGAYSPLPPFGWTYSQVPPTEWNYSILPAVGWSYPHMPPVGWAVGDGGFVSDHWLPKQRGYVCLPLYAGQTLHAQLLWHRGGASV